MDDLPANVFDLNPKLEARKNREEAELYQAQITSGAHQDYLQVCNAGRPKPVVDTKLLAEKNLLKKVYGYAEKYHFIGDAINAMYHPDVSFEDIVQGLLDATMAMKAVDSSFDLESLLKAELRYNPDVNLTSLASSKSYFDEQLDSALKDKNHALSYLFHTKRVRLCSESDLKDGLGGLRECEHKSEHRPKRQMFIEKIIRYLSHKISHTIGNNKSEYGFELGFLVYANMQRYAKTIAEQKYRDTPTVYIQAFKGKIEEILKRYNSTDTYVEANKQARSELYQDVRMLCELKNLELNTCVKI